MPLTIEDRESLDREIQRVKSARYAESAEQVAGWNYERSQDGRGLLFHELPESDRQVMVEDYVDWSRYMERGLTPAEQGRLMAEAAADPLPKMPEIEPAFTDEELRQIHKDIEEDRFAGFRERMLADPGFMSICPDPASREAYIREGFDREAAREFAEIAARPGDATRNLLANFSIRAAEQRIANDDLPEQLQMPNPAEMKGLLADMREEAELRRGGEPVLDSYRTGRETFAGEDSLDVSKRSDPLEIARQRARDASREPGRGRDGPEV